MKAKKYWILLILTLLEIPLSCDNCLAIEQGRFHSEVNSYSFTLPQDWKQIPENVVRERYSKLLSSQTRSTVLYEAEFQLEAEDKWFQLPTILVMVGRYLDLGKSRPLYEDELGDFVKSFTGRDVMEFKDRLFDKDMTDAISGYTVGKVSVDKANRCYRFVSEVTVDEESRIKSEVVGYFGKEAIVQLVFNHFSESDWSQFETERSLIFGSFQFDPGMRYEDVPSKGSGILDRLGEAVAKGLGYGLIALVLGLIFGLFKLITYLTRPRKKPKAEQKQ